MKSYINKAGKTIIIAEMPNNYLLNSYSATKKRLDQINKVGGSEHIESYKQTLQNKVNSLWAEIQKRNLISAPVDNRG